MIKLLFLQDWSTLSKMGRKWMLFSDKELLLWRRYIFAFAFVTWIRFCFSLLWRGCFQRCRRGACERSYFNLKPFSPFQRANWAGHSRERIERGNKVILRANLPVNEWRGIPESEFSEPFSRWMNGGGERIERGIKVILLAILPVNEWPRDRISDSEKDGKSLTLIWVAHIRNSSGS